MASTRECVSCMGDESDGDIVLYETECGSRHFMCVDCLRTLFKLAAKDEKHYPPRCCNDETSVLLISKFEEVLPFEVAWDFQAKEAGEYSINPKSRVYCANASCAAFLHPESHRQHTATSKVPSESLASSDAESSTSSSESSRTSITSVTKAINYAPCEICGNTTCTSCKSLIETDIETHQCQDVSDDEKQFRSIVEEKGYQECYNCGSTVELSEACNHLTCSCGYELCYVCGKQWEGLHGCPHYGPISLDAEGYNQDGFHKETGLNRDGRTRQQQINHDRGADDEDGSDDEHDNRPRIPFPPELQQAVDNGIIPFQEAFEQWQISMIETGQIIDVNQFLQQPDNVADGHAGDDEEDERPDGNIDEDEGNEDRVAAEGDDGTEHDDESVEEEDFETESQEPDAPAREAVTEPLVNSENDNLQNSWPQGQLTADTGDQTTDDETQSQEEVPATATITWFLPDTPNDDDDTKETVPLPELLSREPTTATGVPSQVQAHQGPSTIVTIDHHNLPMPYALEDEL